MKTTLLVCLCVVMAMPGQAMAQEARQKKQRSERPAPIATQDAPGVPASTVANACALREEPDWDATAAASGVNRFAVIGELEAASIYMSGTPDYRGALVHVRAAADAGHPAGRYMLGMMYMDGLGVERNQAEGARWLAQAAAQGNSAAQFSFGRACLAGIGVPASPAEARQWIGKAADQGHAPARQWLEANR